MNCPVCANGLQPTTVGAVTVDVCVGGCGGMWFDNFELQKFDEPHEYAHELLFKVAVRQPLQVDPTQKRCCPKCEDMVMMRHFFSARRRVEVDECPNCGGYWLDAGELALIREEHQGEQEGEMAVEKYLAETSKAKLAAMREGGRDQADRARRIGNVLRFTSPIRYRTSSA